jgi:hypothetical protein
MTALCGKKIHKNAVRSLVFYADCYAYNYIPQAQPTHNSVISIADN